MRDVAVVIPAGGVGTRLGRRTPKQFLALGGAPILVATVRHFVRHRRVNSVVVAAPAAHVERTRRMLERGRGAPVTVVEGGGTRQESVSRGLAAVPADSALVVVHDAVRPFITRVLIDAVLGAARATGAAICALPIAETVKRVSGGVVESTVDRAELVAVQTPQAFRADLLREAHGKARRDGFIGTDDAMLVERLGQSVQVVPGLAENVKITTPVDLRRARARARS
ncbi:MAG: 2-C-methyl-D-erythritol 4-phosphate cytidylyltransferase [Candidatus Rokubacteria bacterium 13_2_20CM_2_64_8]|nr:MAG: 2-C-methyl-D-erythritol 4-phosphate cytidylyltransferase [Candidatus Rokubacteria bacterium 13_2_20CM_2_64_8]